MNVERPIHRSLSMLSSSLPSPSLSSITSCISYRLVNRLWMAIFRFIFLFSFLLFVWWRDGGGSNTHLTNRFVYAIHWLFVSAHARVRLFFPLNFVFFFFFYLTIKASRSGTRTHRVDSTSQSSKHMQSSKVRVFLHFIFIRFHRRVHLTTI